MRASLGSPWSEEPLSKARAPQFLHSETPFHRDFAAAQNFRTPLPPLAGIAATTSGARSVRVCAGVWKSVRARFKVSCRPPISRA